MDSSLDSSMLAGSWPARQVLRLRRFWWPGWGLARTLVTPDAAPSTERAQPRLQFNVRGYLVMATGLAVLAIVGSLAWVDLSLGNEARAYAQTLAQRVNHNLERLEDELASQPVDEQDGELACTALMTRQLAIRSLESTLARRFFVQRGDRVCGPLGEEQQVVPTSAHRGVLLEHVSGSVPRLDARRWRDERTLLRAEVDVVALQHLLGVGGRSSQHAAWLKNDAGEVLLALDDSPHDGKRWLSAQAGVGSHPMRVAVEVDQAQVLSDAGRLAVRAVLVCWLMLATAATWAWSRTVSRARLSQRILRALRKRQFEPFVQPVVELANGRCVGGEILMRWQHPERGCLPPSAFIDEAERTGLIVPMTRLVMDKAAQRLANLAQADPRLQFAFNVTPADLCAPGFAQVLAEVFNPHTMPPAQVMLEVTEREFVGPGAAAALDRLHQAGWKIAMDDFGTGHSSLAVLEQVKVHRIKIDRAFVATLDEHTEARPVLDAIIGLASSLGVPLVAEGVETEAQRQYLHARGVQYAQGYLFARPMPMAEFERWWAEREGVGVEAARGLTGVAADAPARQALQAMVGPAGVSHRPRWWRMRRYDSCFIGRDAVDWLVRHQGMSREAARQLGRRMVARGWIQHVLHEHDFEDANVFYRVMATDDAAQPGPPVPPGLADELASPAGPLRTAVRRGVAVHRRCASGRDVERWIVRRHGVDAAQACQWAAQLMRSGRLRHVFDDRPFSASRQLYRMA